MAITTTFISKVNTDIVATASGNTVYTVPGSTTATLLGVSLANKTANVMTANVWITRSGTRYYIAANTTIYPGSTFVPIGGDQKMVMVASDTFSVSASVNAASDIILSALETS